MSMAVALTRTAPTMPPSAPKSPCSVSPFLANTTRVNEPASTTWPGSSGVPSEPSLLASQATPIAGWPSTPAATPVSSISEFTYMMPPTQRRSTSIGRTGRPPITMPAAGAVVRHGVEDLARVLHAGVDDLERRHHVVGRGQHVGQPHARAHQLLAEHEGELDLDARPAIVGMRHLGAVRDDHVVVQVAEIRLVDLRGALHRLGGQADLVADQLHGPPRSGAYARSVEIV